MTKSLLSVCLLLAVCAALGAAEPRKRVVLVVDDGPLPEYNARFLAMLAREQVRVTFSHVGKSVVANPGLAKTVAEAGHEIINHSYTHAHMKQMTDAAITKEVADTQAAIRQETGRAPAWFWAPFLEHDERVDAAVRAAGLEHFPYSRYNFIGSHDWDPATTDEKYLQLTTTGIVDGTVILMHEWPAVTLENLPRVITELKRQNVDFVTFSELAKQVVVP